MGWLTTSVRYTTEIAYDQSKAKATDTYRQTRSRMGLDGEQPDAGEQQAQLADEMSTETDLTAEDREIFDQMSSEQMGRWVSDLQHRDQIDMLGRDEFIREYWPKAREGIENNDALREKFKLDDDGHRRAGQNGPVCTLHDTPGTINEVTYTPEVTETTGRTATKDTTGSVEVSPAGQGKFGSGTKEGEAAKAERRERQQGTVEVCAKDPNDATSRNAIFWEAEQRHVKLRGLNNKSNGMYDQFDTPLDNYINEEIAEDENVAASVENSETESSHDPNETTEEQKRTEDNTTHSETEQAETDSNDSVDEETANQNETEQTTDKGQQLLDSFLTNDEDSSETTSTSASESTDSEETDDKSATADESTPPEEPNEEESTDTTQDEETTDTTRDEDETADKGDEMLDQYSSGDEFSSDNNSENNSKNGNNSL